MRGSFALFSAAIALIATLGLSSESLAQQTAPVVLTKSVSTENFRPSFEHPGRIEALQTATVRPIIPAQITAIHVKPGDLVEEGDVLIELDDTDYRIALTEAEANLLKAQANLTKTQADFERATQLFERDTGSERDRDFAEANRDVAIAEVKLAEARLEKAQKNLADTVVRAPFSGRVGKPNYAVGDLFQPGDPTQPATVIEMVALDPIYAIGRVDQTNYFNFISRRLKLEEEGFSIPPLEISLILPGSETYPHLGTFENWDNTAVSSTGTIAARIIVPNPDGLLLPGQNVTIRGEIIEPVEAVMVPQRAVLQDQQGAFVYVVDAENTVERRNVVLGIRNGADWSVREGLTDGDEVIIEGLQKARPGQQVTPQEFQG